MTSLQRFWPISSGDLAQWSRMGLTSAATGKKLIFQSQDGGQLMCWENHVDHHQISRFFYFLDGSRPPSWILKIKIFNSHTLSYIFLITVPNFMEINHTVEKISRFLDMRQTMTNRETDQTLCSNAEDSVARCLQLLPSCCLVRRRGLSASLHPSPSSTTNSYNNNKSGTSIKEPTQGQ